MANRKFKWWLLLIPVLAAAVILAIAFWDTIAVYMAPKAVLTNALSDTVSRLDERFRSNPIRNLVDVYDREGKYTAQIELETSQELLGTVSYDMTVQTDLSANQAFAQGNIGFSGTNLALSMYLNGDFMAISSDELVNGAYYGITYDTFSEDLDHFPLVKHLIPSATMQKWESSLESIQELMTRSYEVPEITSEDIRMLMAAILLLDSQVSREDIQLNGERVSSFVITYSAAGEAVRDILGYVLDVSNAPEGEITASFYLYNNAVVKVELDGAAGENQISYILTLGEDALTAPLTLTENRRENGSISDFSLAVSTSMDTGRYVETVNFTQTADESSKAVAVSYDWNTETGDMILSWNHSMPIRLNLTRNEDGICMVTDDFAQLMAILQKKEEGSTDSASCTMLLRKGSSVAAPAYKNLDKWSMEDLVTLLTGIGSLIGFRLT